MTEMNSPRCQALKSGTPTEESRCKVSSSLVSVARPVAARLASILVVAFTSTALAQPGAQQEVTKKSQEPSTRDTPADPRDAVERVFSDPLGGVVVNRTVTVLGKDFYRYFSTRWRQFDESARYSISIHERPTARFGSEIWVQYRQQRMFHAFLPPARSATRQISEVAVEQVLQNITRRELERLTTRNPDLGPEEL